MKKVGSDGAVSWNWTPAAVGLSPGHWNVKVIAALGGHEATAHDVLGLTVVP